MLRSKGSRRWLCFFSFLRIGAGENGRPAPERPRGTGGNEGTRERVERGRTSEDGQAGERGENDYLIVFVSKNYFL